MATQHVHRVVRTDNSELVLLHVRTQSKGELDLEIEGTEGETPFFAHFKHSQLTKALLKSSDLSSPDWDRTLRLTLLQQRPSCPSDTSLLRDLELTASIGSDGLILCFRKNIDGIHQRIAELALPDDDSRELDTLAWVHAAAARGDGLEAEARRVKADFDEQAGVIRELQGRLESLVAAKEQHEGELLGKFARLLNAKKGKVRDQQRLLSGSKVDAEKAAAIARSRGNAADSAGSGGAKEAASSRARKRKPAARARDASSDSDEFESMKGAQAPRAGAQQAKQDEAGPDDDDDDDDDQADASTASAQSDRETTDNEGISDASEASPSSSRPVAGEREGANRKVQTTTAGIGKGEETEAALLPPPPRRALPFGKLASAKSPAKESSSSKRERAEEMDVDDDATTEEETDDEL